MKFIGPPIAAAGAGLLGFVLTGLRSGCLACSVLSSIISTVYR
jgi:hypothetical protein